MPSTPSAFVTLLFAAGLFAPTVLVVAGVVLALVTRAKR